jgi:hypothetical protein
MHHSSFPRQIILCSSRQILEKSLSTTHLAQPTSHVPLQKFDVRADAAEKREGWKKVRRRQSSFIMRIKKERKICIQIVMCDGALF